MNNCYFDYFPSTEECRGKQWRRGKWFKEEEVYTAKLIDSFKAGILKLPQGTTLRSFLSLKLNCDPMRISKKFAGPTCVGKQIFHPSIEAQENTEAVLSVEEELLELERKFLQKVEQTEARGMRKLQRWCYSNPMPMQVQDPSYYYVGYPNDQSFNMQAEYNYPQQYPPVQNYIKIERSNVQIKKENKKTDLKSVHEEEEEHDVKRMKSSNEKEASDLLLNFFNVANSNIDSPSAESCLDSSISSSTSIIKSDASGSDAGTTSQGDEDDSSGQNNKDDSDGSNGIIPIFPTTSQQTATARAQYEQNHRGPLKFSQKSHQLQDVTYGYEEYPEEVISDNSAESSGQDLLESHQQQQQQQQYYHHPSQSTQPPAYYQPHHLSSAGPMYMWPSVATQNNTAMISRNSYPITYTTAPPTANTLPLSPIRSHSQAQYAYLQQQQQQYQHQQQWLQMRQQPSPMLYYPATGQILNSSNLTAQQSRKRHYE